MKVTYQPEGTKVVPVKESFWAVHPSHKIGLRVYAGEAEFVAWSSSRARYDSMAFAEKSSIPFLLIEELVTAYKEARDDLHG